MPFYPTVPEIKQTQIMTNIFLGYNRNPEAGEGQGNGLEFWDTKNLTSDYYPMLANRGKRSSVTQLSAPGGMLAKEALAIADGGKLYYNGLEVTGITLSDGEKQMVSMGAYLIIWPDRVYLNTKDLTDFGSIDSTYETNTSISLSSEQVKQLQNALGVTADGKWGSNSSSAAGGLSADEAWSKYMGGNGGERQFKDIVLSNLTDSVSKNGGLTSSQISQMKNYIASKMLTQQEANWILDQLGV